MPKWFFLIIFLFIVSWPCTAQFYTHPTPEDVKALILQLKYSQPDSNRVDILVKLGNYYFSKVNRTLTDTDSTFQMAQTAEALSLSLKYTVGEGESYVLYSQVCRVKLELTKGKDYVNKAIALFENHPLQLGEAYVEKRMYYSIYGKDLTERIRIMELAVPAFHKAGNKEREADSYKELGDLYQIQGSLPQSLSALKKGLQLYQSINYPYLTGIYDLLGFVSTALGDQKEGIHYGILAMQAAERLQDSTTQLCTIYNRLGITYVNVLEFNKAAIYFHKSLLIAQRHNDLNAVYELATNITSLLLQINQPAEALAFLQGIVRKYPFTDSDSRLRVTAIFVNIHGLLHQYKLAATYCDQLLKIPLLNDEERTLVYTAVIRLSLATQNYPRALQYLTENETLVKKTGIKMNAAVNHLYWFQLDSAQGNYAAAITHYQQYKILNDQLFNESKSRQISQLEILYDIENKDHEIRLKGQNIQLLTRQSQLQRNQLHQANLMRNITFLCLGLLLIIVGLLYNRYRMKQRSNRKLEAQQAEINLKNASLQHLLTEKEWLLKEIHHRVKNNLHMIVGLLDTQSSFLKNEDALLAVAESQHRVQSMSLIHQKLYQSENLSTIDMQAYIYELTDYLRDCFNTGLRIRFDLQIAPVSLPLSHSIPLGLILNEAITNAIKYAFPDNREGIITISLQNIYGNEFVLMIGDNGVGLPSGFEQHLGMTLMQGLSGDVDGSFEIENDHGTKITIVFLYE
jgi:two-component sensor histidine kinase